MSIFIVGDVHGCYYTFKEMVDRHWRREKELLIQLGDLIDRGNYSPQMVQYAQLLKMEHPEKTVFLKGNHEFEAILHEDAGPHENWLRQCGRETLKQYEAAGRSFTDDVNWFRELPLIWENEHVHVCHAGVSEKAILPYDGNDPHGLLWNRSPLRNIGKLQVIGHTPIRRPAYDEALHAVNIDTGAAYSRFLTGVRVSLEGEIMEYVHIPTDKRDLPA